jgi:hypothetical protein
VEADDAQAARRARWLLAGGALAGIALAAAGLVRGAALPGAAFEEGELARVNGTPIRAEVLDRLVGALALDKRTPVTADDRRRVFDRLLEEELLVQRAVEIGMVESEPGVRKALVQALLESIVAEAESAEPDPAELRRFYEERPEYFGGGPRVRIEQLVFRDASGRPAARAREAREALRGGEPLEAVRERLADDPVVPLPNALLPPSKLREYLGSRLDAALAAPAGEWSEPLEEAGDVQLLRVAERKGAEVPSYDAVAPQVEAEWRREQADRALREYLDGLRAQADLVLGPDAPR